MGGASGLPRNLHLGFEVEVAGYVSKITSSSEIFCDECIDGRNGPAEVFCCTCCQFMCTFCHEHHKRSRKLFKHTMVGLDQEGARQLQAVMKPRQHYCTQPNHEDNKLDLHCESCEVLVCKDCKRVAHKDHVVNDLSTVAKDYQGDINNVLGMTQETVAKLKETILENSKLIEQVEVMKGNALMDINQTFQLLHVKLEERKYALLLELEAISLSKTTALTLQKEKFEKLVEDLDRYAQVGTQVIQTHSEQELVALGHIISNGLQSILRSIQSMDVAPNQHSDIFACTRTDDVVKELSTFGHIIEFSPPSSTWTSTSAAKVGSSFVVKVQSKTSNGEGYSHGGVQVRAELKSNDPCCAAVCGKVEDCGDGSYTVTLIPQTIGPHQLLVTMNGQHVQNSPHDLDVKQCVYLHLHNADQMIGCRDPLCVTIHDSGDIYVGSSDNSIYVFNQAGQRKDTVIGRAGTGDGEFNRPLSILIKGDEMYVADCHNHRIQKLTLTGQFRNKFGQKGVGPGQFDGPVSVIGDAADNRLIVSDWGNHRVQIFTNNGDWLSTIEGSGDSHHCFRNPWGLALDPRGNIHVAAYGSNVVKVFSNEGVYIRLYGGESKGPKGLFIDHDGYSFLGEGDGDTISIFDWEGNKIHAMKNLNNPRGIALDPWGDRLYVANWGIDAVLVYILDPSRMM